MNTLAPALTEEKHESWPAAALRVMSSREGVFALQLVFVAVLVALAALYVTGVIDRQTIGSIPIAVPWWGAVGAVLLSLSAVFDHRDDWKADMAIWHWARPIFGVFMSSFAILAFQAGVLAVGKDLKPASGVLNTQNLFYYVLAFIVGYREETARTLIKRVGDVIIGPGDAPAPAAPAPAPAAVAPAITSLDPATGAAGATVTVAGTGLSQVQGVSFGAAAAAFAADSDSQLTVTVPDGSGAVSVVFTLPTGDPLTAQFTYADA